VHDGVVVGIRVAIEIRLIAGSGCDWIDTEESPRRRVVIPRLHVNEARNHYAKTSAVSP